MIRARGTPILVRGNSGHGHGPCRGSWLALFSDGRRASDAHLEDLRDPAAITIDVRFLPSAEARDPGRPRGAGVMQAPVTFKPRPCRATVRAAIAKSRDDATVDRSAPR
jgi:hypothetical protein